MKHLEWILSAALIILGILCMALSCTPGLHSGYMSFIHLLLVICLWIAIPFLIVQFIYFLIVKRKRNDK